MFLFHEIIVNSCIENTDYNLYGTHILYQSVLQQGNIILIICQAMRSAT